MKASPISVKRHLDHPVFVSGAPRFGHGCSEGRVSRLIQGIVLMAGRVAALHGVGGLGVAGWRRHKNPNLCYPKPSDPETLFLRA